MLVHMLRSIISATYLGLLVPDTSGSTVIAVISGPARGSRQANFFFFFVMCVASLLEHFHPQHMHKTQECQEEDRLKCLAFRTFRAGLQRLHAMLRRNGVRCHVVKINLSLRFNAFNISPFLPTRWRFSPSTPACPSSLSC